MLAVRDGPALRRVRFVLGVGLLRGKAGLRGYAGGRESGGVVWIPMQAAVRHYGMSGALGWLGQVGGARQICLGAAMSVRRRGHLG